MHNKKIIIFLSILLAGCANKKLDKEISADQLVYDELSKQAITIKLAQDELYQAGAINRTNFKLPTVIMNDAQHIRVDWQGDAKELLAQLAKQRGKKFSTQGLSLPLPTNINVVNASYYSVINLIQEQVGYRGVIEDRTDAIILHYRGNTKIHKNAQWR
ncbi:DotD/TraH family lipoprotein [Photorhabdus asymbiotica]|uniref:DotD/TraH family lipoprotein n=2 Tax=Photorhabdus asymbiotica TaxID=291112 RepID=UPI003DA6D4EC